MSKQRWTVANPDNSKILPWVLYHDGAPVRPFASFGSAYNAMMNRIEQESTANADA